MVLSNAYNYINVLDKAADASWTRNDVLANNIANADTPGYKRKDDVRGHSWHGSRPCGHQSGQSLLVDTFGRDDA